MIYDAAMCFLEDCAGPGSIYDAESSYEIQHQVCRQVDGLQMHQFCSKSLHDTQSRPTISKGQLHRPESLAI
jgi:hypothetical protein